MAIGINPILSYAYYVFQGKGRSLVVEQNAEKAALRSASGEAKFFNGDLSEAVAEFSEAIDIQPSASRNYNDRGNARAYMGLLVEAADDYTKAITLDSSSWGSYYNRGNVNAQLGLWVEAIRDYTSALELDPKSLLPYANRGCARWECGMFSEAMDDFRKFLASAPVGFPLRAQIEERVKSAVDTDTIENGEKENLEVRRSFDRSYRLLVYAKRYKEAVQGFVKIAESNANAALAKDAAFNAACGYALMGERSVALQWLKSAYDAGWRDLDRVKTDADLKDLHQEPGYKNILRSMEGC